MIFGTRRELGHGAALAMPIGVAIAIYLALLAPAASARTCRSAGRADRGDSERDRGSVGHPRSWRRSCKSTSSHGSTTRSVSSRCSVRPRPAGASIFTAGLVLTIMIMPIIASLSRDLFLTVPHETDRRSRGAGRDALGGDPRGGAAEHRARGDRGLGPRARTSARRGDRGDPGDRRRHRDSRLAVQDRRHARQPDRRAVSGYTATFRAALFYLALVLLVIGLVVNLIAQWISHRFDVRAGIMSEQLFDPTAPLVPSGNLRRRQFVSRVASGGARASAYLAVARAGAGGLLGHEARRRTR